MSSGVDPIVFYLTIFVLAVFVGYHVIWNVTPALHTPLMSLTNAISSIILVGAMLAAGPAELDWGGWLGVLAVALVSINTFGGFLVTQRMLEMCRKKEPKSAETKSVEKKERPANEFQSTRALVSRSRGQLHPGAEGP